MRNRERSAETVHQDTLVCSGHFDNLQPLTQAGLLGNVGLAVPYLAVEACGISLESGPRFGTALSLIFILGQPSRAPLFSLGLFPVFPDNLDKLGTGHLEAVHAGGQGELGLLHGTFVFLRIDAIRLGANSGKCFRTGINHFINLGFQLLFADFSNSLSLTVNQRSLRVSDNKCLCHAIVHVKEFITSRRCLCTHGSSRSQLGKIISIFCKFLRQDNVFPSHQVHMQFFNRCRILVVGGVLQFTHGGTCARTG